MLIHEAVEADALAFEHPLQTDSGKLRKALAGLNGHVLPITPTGNDSIANLRAAIYHQAKVAGVTVATTVHDGIIYVWTPRENNGQ